MKRALLLAISLMLVTGVLVWALTNFQSAQCVLGQTNYTNNGANGTVGRSLGINYPGSVCSDGTRLFVADANNDRILIYNTIPTSNLARPDVVIGQTCLSDVETNQNDFVTLNNYLSDPQGVYCDGTRLYIADTGNNRVLIYNTVPTANNQAADTVVGHWGSSATSATMSSPYAVWGDGTRMVVADYGNNRVLVYNNIALLPVSNGTADHVIGQANMTASSANEGGACSQYSLRSERGEQRRHQAFCGGPEQQPGLDLQRPPHGRGPCGRGQCRRAGQLYGEQPQPGRQVSCRNLIRSLVNLERRDQAIYR